MLQSLKKFSWILLLACGQHSAWAFALGGPIGNASDAWQVPTIGYGIGGDLVAPKNLGEEYRRNSQVYYYACDASFLNFFGTDGSTAIDQAFVILNSSLTNVDGYSAGLTEFPLNSQTPNLTAGALDLIDLKSETMGAMLEQLGLANPVRYVFTLHDRFLPSGGVCPTNEEYVVVQRNFEIAPTGLTTPQYSAYINGDLYIYSIQENCKGPNPLAFTANTNTTGINTVVAGNASSLRIGGYYDGLTRDDEAGLRYLLTTNNVNFETPAPGSILVNSTTTGGTNYGAPFPLYTLDYTTFSLAAQTNDPVALANLYPGLIITSSSNYFTIQATPNVVAYFTNLIGAPAGSQTFVIATNGYTYTVVTNYVYKFANIIVPPGSHTNKNSTFTLITTQVTPLVGGTSGTLQTNKTTKTITLTNVTSGDFYILTNPCGPHLILSTLLTNVVVTTNVAFATNNAAGLAFSQITVSRATNHIFTALPIECGAVAVGGSTNAPGLYQGVNKIKFVKTSYDSLIGQFFQPVTNTYSMVLLVNSKLVSQTFQRVATEPDFRFSAAELVSGPDKEPAVNSYSRNINFDQGNIVSGQAGPGTITTPTGITFNKAGPVYFNFGPDNTNGPGIFSELNWGSFDGSTNDPVVYPNGTSIANLINQVLVQITPTTLPDGTNGVAYTPTTFVVTGGAFIAPFTWSSPSGLPDGLTLSSGGTISGTPTQPGVYDFTVQLTDSLSHSVQWNYTLTIQ